MRVEVLDGVERRRRWSREDKARIIEETLARGAKVSEVARRHGISASLVFTWRRQSRASHVPAAVAPRFAAVRNLRVTDRNCRFDDGRATAGCGKPKRCDRNQSRRWSARAGRCERGCGCAGPCSRCAGATMITVPGNVRVWLATGHTDMRRGFRSLALMVQEELKRDPHCGDLYVFRGRRSDLIKIIWHDGQGACLFSKRLDRKRFLWPAMADGVVTVSIAQLSYLLSGIDWRMPQEVWRPQVAG